MKKILTLLTILVLGFSTFVPQTQAATIYSVQQHTEHLKKDGTPDRRFKKNKRHKKHVRKDGKPDRRYKENKK
ncbi:hypothetical protein [Mucilaginibacter sp. SP1R1]|uniref:hypothetical protein n=1 Tax=Mucilaginibacter sp. SP1R1 TaxID=2723091 RepID=UPI0016197C18|nr:hypothetical protein [Mucilaginibacter sp. SP1R1]MBB6148288.1 hypothetical protein [Mucilaginibacter sp. SP1R1]